MIDGVKVLLTVGSCSLLSVLLTGVVYAGTLSPAASPSALLQFALYDK